MGQLSAKKAQAAELSDISARIKSGQISKIIVMCGAGVSTSAGIPDFRSPNLGIYFKLKKYNLPYPEAVFEAAYFKQNPVPFYSLVRELYPDELRPTLTHKFFKLLENKGILRRIYTQNIDALEHLAGVDAEKIIEAHGTFQTSTCLKCGEKYQLDWLKQELNAHDEAVRCSKEHCRGSVKPDVVLFGESLPSRYFASIKSDFRDCDLLVVMGTSLTVFPFASLIDEGPSSMTRLFINRTKPGQSSGILGWLTSRSVDFSGENDAVYLGDCDDAVKTICDDLGWTDELNAIQVQVLTG